MALDARRGGLAGVAQGRPEWSAGGPGWVWPCPGRERPGGGQSGGDVASSGGRWAADLPGSAGRAPSMGVTGRRQPNCDTWEHELRGRNFDTAVIR
jgi:hypothetical protein